MSVTRLKTILFLVLGYAASLANAQQLVSSGRDPRFEALNAVFRFRDDLRDTTTVIARCRLFDVANALDPHFRRLFVLPATTDSARLQRCAVSEFAIPKTRVLWLSGLVEITRAGEMRPADQKQFEITLQLLLGPDLREYHRYLVGPTGVNVLDPTANPYHYQFSGWRVLEYKFLGADYDWGTGLGSSAGFRRP
jgi:hypothetical protein